MKIEEPQLGYAARGLYYGGRWVEPESGRSFASINPSTGRKLGDVPYADANDVDRAVKAAAKAFADWRKVGVKERARCLEAWAKRVREHAKRLALIDAVDAGNAVKGMEGDMHWTADSLEYFAGLITEVKGSTSSQGPRHRNFTRRQPYGVVAKLNAFNHPFRFCVAHPLVPRIGFIGSVETGRLVAKGAAEGLKRVTLELGGKNPIIVFPDADPKQAASAAIKGMNMNRQGQSCSSTSRVFVHESLHRAVVEEIVRLANGFFIRPAVFDDVRQDMRIAREEIFGPVMSVLPWSEAEDMLAQVNSVEYGLTAAIVTNRLDLAMQTAEQVEAGYVWNASRSC